MPTVTQSGLEPESCLLVLLTHILQPILNIEKLKPGESGAGGALQSQGSAGERGAVGGKALLEGRGSLPA